MGALASEVPIWSDGSEVPVRDLKWLHLAWLGILHSLPRPWTMAWALPNLLPFPSPFLDWKFKNQLKTFVVLAYHYDWHTLTRFKRKAGRRRLWNMCVNPDEDLGEWVISFEEELFLGCVWSVSWFLDFQLKLYEQNWIQRFILIVRHWNSWAQEAGVAEWLQRLITKTACERSTKRRWRDNKKM